MAQSMLCAHCTATMRKMWKLIFVFSLSPAFIMSLHKCVIEWANTAISKWALPRCAHKQIELENLIRKWCHFWDEYDPSFFFFFLHQCNQGTWPALNSTERNFNSTSLDWYARARSCAFYPTIWDFNFAMAHNRLPHNFMLKLIAVVRLPIETSAVFICSDTLINSLLLEWLCLLIDTMLLVLLHSLADHWFNQNQWIG